MISEFASLSFVCLLFLGAVISSAQELSEPERNFEHLWNEFDRRYALFLPKRIDWDLLYRVYRQKVTPQTSDDELFASGDELKQCPLCGLTLKQFCKTGVLGCAHDYEFFEEELLPLIEKAHDGCTRHRGKVPTRNQPSAVSAENPDLRKTGSSRTGSASRYRRETPLARTDQRVTRQRERSAASVPARRFPVRARFSARNH